MRTLTSTRPCALPSGTLDHRPRAGGKVPEVTPSAKPDRYEPLPGLLEIPGYLVRKIPPRARRPAGIAAAILLVAATVALVLSIPAITDSKEDRAAAEQQAERERRAQRAAELKAEQRLVNGRGTAAAGLSGSDAVEARQALVEDLSAAVREDSARRVQAGEFKQTVHRVECERYPRGARGENPATDLTKATGRYSCLAITADAPRIETNEASSLGYPYRALLHFESGRFSFCKISGKPGEGSLTREFPVRVPPACGGAG
jgi:hypothetical protein